VFAACPPRLARNARTYEIALSVPTPSPTGLLPAGSKVRWTSSDPGRALLTGFVGGPVQLDDWEKFDIPGLRGIRKTAPYFHNNSAATLEEVVDHYIEFFKVVQANAVPGAPSRRSRRPMACTSIGGPRPTSALRSSRICESCSALAVIDGSAGLLERIKKNSGVVPRRTRVCQGRTRCSFLRFWVAPERTDQAVKP
jgi:hypothetical protein